MVKFTDRFIKVPICVFNIKHKELTGNEDCKESWLKFNPMELSNYKPSYDEGEPDVEIVYIELKNGYGCLVYLSVSEFEKLLNNHMR